MLLLATHTIIDRFWDFSFKVSVAWQTCNETVLNSLDSFR